MEAEPAELNCIEVDFENSLAGGALLYDAPEAKTKSPF